jgi:hypothetical protein
MTDPVIYSAGQQLAALVTAIRLDDWAPEDVHAVIAGAHQVGMTWEQTVVGLVRLAVDPEAKPRDLIPVHQDPLRRPAEPNEEFRATRARLHNTTREDT